LFNLFIIGASLMISGLVPKTMAIFMDIFSVIE